MLCHSVEENMVSSKEARILKLESIRSIGYSCPICLVPIYILPAIERRLFGVSYRTFYLVEIF